MSALSISVPYPVFSGQDGLPLDNGYVWIGTANLYPITNQIAVYFDEALTIQATQPLRTINGFISNAGTPAQVYVDAVNFSILVQDSKGTMVYNFPDGTGLSPDACGVTYDPPFTGGVAYPVCEKLEQTVSVKDFGAVGDGVTDDTAAFEAALAASDAVVVPASGTYVVKLANVPSNKTIEAYGAVIINPDTGNTGIYSLAAGVSNVTLLGGSYRGPAFGGTPNPSSPAYPASNGCIRILGTFDNVCSNITIKDVEIVGWDVYGIFAENVVRGTFNCNHIHTIGRDGVRTYGAVMTDVSHNHIHDITPGFSGVAPNLNAYGVTFTRNPTNEGTPLINHPPSSFCTCNNNLVENVPTWKGLDTHGGVNIVFADNVIRNCRFGFGIDEGDTSGLENAPPINITIANNIMIRGIGNAGAAGVNISSSSASNRGLGVKIQGNTISEFGGTGTGAINVAYQDEIQIVNNTLINSAVSGINFAASTTNVNALIDNNTIKNLTGSVLAAIAVQSANSEGFIKGGSFIRTTGAYTAISLAAPASGFGFRVSEDLNYRGTITKWATGALSRVVSGSVITQAKAYARVNSAGVLSAANNIESVVKDATGEYTVTLQEGGLSATSIVPLASTRSATSAFSINADATSGLEIKIYTYDSSGTAADCPFYLVVFGI